MTRRLPALLLALCLLVGLCPAALADGAPLAAADLQGSSWYGEYAGETGGAPVTRFIDLTVLSCDGSGALSGVARVTTLSGQGHDEEWFEYDFTGTVDFASGAFHMQGTYLTGHYTGINWNMVPFDGTLERNAAGEPVIRGWVDNDRERDFSVRRTSTWAKDEMTEANLRRLVPDALLDSDMSRPATRAEFAAVAVRLYEVVTGQTAPSTDLPFADARKHPLRADIEKAYALGVTLGTSQTTFDPDAMITREQMATMLCRVVKGRAFPDWTPQTDGDFPLETAAAEPYADDDRISDFAREAVYYMTGLGVMQGVGEGRFAPRSVTDQERAALYATATREQAVVTALRLYQCRAQWETQPEA